MSKKICDNCGQEMPDSVKVCGLCGKQLNVSKFCANCGTALEKEAKFCAKCGEKQDDAPQQQFQPPPAQLQWQQPLQPQQPWPQQQPLPQWQHPKQPPPVQPQWPSNLGVRTVIRRSNAKKSTIIIGWISVVIEIISGAVGIGAGVYIGEIARQRSWQYRLGYSSTNLEIFQPIFIFAAVFCFIMAFIQLFKTLAVSKTFVCICEEGVYGVAGKALYFTTQPFEVTFDQITNVGKGNPIIGNIRIDCGPHTYGCIISDPQRMINDITEKLNQRRSYYNG